MCAVQCEMMHSATEWIFPYYVQRHLHQLIQNDENVQKYFLINCNKCAKLWLVEGADNFVSWAKLFSTDSMPFFVNPNTHWGGD